jgi:hypothetical protein
MRSERYSGLNDRRRRRVQASPRSPINLSVGRLSDASDAFLPETRHKVVGCGGSGNLVQAEPIGRSAYLKANWRF